MMFEFSFPCKVGDTVMAYLEDAPTKKRELYHLSRCEVLRIEFHKDWPEPLFTAVSYEKALYNTFWLSDFGKEIFSIDQYIALLMIDSNAE